MRFLTTTTLVVGLTLFTLSSAQAQTAVESVRQFVAAFNQHNVEAMTSGLADDVQWLYIQGERMTVETQGKAKLVAAMDDYFAACPSCRSELVELSASGDYVTTIEKARWQQNGQTKSQRSVAVYEFAEGLIQRVYYFPAHKVPTDVGEKQ